MTASSLATAFSALAILLLTAGCAYGVYLALCRQGRLIARGVLQQIRWWMFPLALLALVLTVATNYLLSQIPLLRWGWWHAIGNTSPSPEMAYFDAPSLIPVALGINLCVLLATPFVTWTYEVGFRAGPGVEAPSWPRRVGWALLSGCPIVLFGASLHIGLAWGLCHGGIATALYIRAFRRIHCQLRHTSALLRQHAPQPPIDGAPTDQAPATWTYHPPAQRRDVASLAAFGSAAFSTVYFWFGTCISIAIALTFGSGVLG